jgi:hypothetical protein
MYRVIHKSVQHFENSQQIDCATERVNYYADRKINSVSLFQERAHAHSCSHLPLGDSSNKYGRSWYADTRVGRDGLSHKCLPYYQRWIFWVSVKLCYKTWRFSLSICIRFNKIRCVFYLLQMLKVCHGLMNNSVYVYRMWYTEPRT